MGMQRTAGTRWTETELGLWRDGSAQGMLQWTDRLRA